MKLFLIGSFLISFFLVVFIVSSQVNKPEVDIRGIYGDPKPLWDKGHHLADLGINAVFVHSGSINAEMMKKVRNEGVKIFAEFPTLNGKDYIEKHPEAWAINEKGKQVEAASWFMGVCPTEPGFRKYRFDQLRDLLGKFDIDGVWMDYVHWHAQFEEPEPILPETCFCENCLSSFSGSKGIKLPDGDTSVKATWILENKNADWRTWRCEVIAEWAEEMRMILDELKPEILLGIYHCPWDDEEFDGARRRILGLDYDLLREYFDVFSPMVYHARMGRAPEWVAENISWFSTRINAEEEHAPKIWPIVQAYNNPYTVSAEEFGKVLKGGLTSASTGVMMFTTRAVADDDDKLQVMKKIYKSKE
jgi:hypothetical protein